MTVDALDPTSRIPEFKVCACRIERGCAVDAVPAPPVPPDIGDAADHETIATDSPPTAPQGRGTGTA
jgi:assimilatory nitrate reductase catalytic subunit